MLKKLENQLDDARVEYYKLLKEVEDCGKQFEEMN